MGTRREFIKNAALLSGAAGLFGAMPASIQRALAIEPEEGSSFLDAEHVVILMQENRSFDHCFGTLQGVRGFNDPRAITLPDGNPVWVQANEAGDRFAPFRLNIKDTSATWMGCLPHTWADQSDARNQGRHDRWLPAKRSGNQAYAEMPLTLGYYTRDDIPFYYALADAFTVCDQHFCSSLTGTTANRLYLWTGTIREKPTPDSPANVRNEDVDHDRWANWTTFPERLEDQGVAWKIYQNELSLASGLTEDEHNWLANFGDNTIEYFAQYHVRFAATHRRFLDQQARRLQTEIDSLTQQLPTAATASERAKLRKQLERFTAADDRVRAEQDRWSAANFDKLSAREKSLHARAFRTNTNDPFYRELAEIAYDDAGVEHRLLVPKGDVLHQFREDVAHGQLPSVSWLVAPANFSDHPSAAWYGAWYLSEVLDILTQNPGVWRKTVFILTYDENDGYFDHAPPFTTPLPDRPETGSVTPGIDVDVEHVALRNDLKRTSPDRARGGPIGLGYRVPMIIASPWSRGGCVCSQVFDHTSVLQFLEKLLTHKTGKKIEETNISRWRRAVCGDLTSAFGPAGQKGAAPPFPPRDTFLEQIHRARFKSVPTGYRTLTSNDLAAIRRDPLASSLLPSQEPGVRPSCALPYELEVEGALDAARAHFVVRLEAGKERFGDRSAGAPFIAHALTGDDGPQIRNFAVEAGQHLEDSWDIGEFAGGQYHVRVYGPNGFFREFMGAADDPAISLRLEYPLSRPDAHDRSGDVQIHMSNTNPRRTFTLEAHDNAYQGADQKRTLAASAAETCLVETQSSFGWYDFTIRIAGSDAFARRYAGRVETGRRSFSDPLMGRAIG